MKKILYIIPALISSLVIVLSSCEEDKGPEPLEKSKEKPGPVTNVQVENFPGRSRITYSLPDNKDLLYIKATYTLPSTGSLAEVKASYYQNNLTVEGFAKEEEYSVSLVAVNRSEVESDPVVTTIKPMRSPIYDVFESIDVANSFGGYNVFAENPTRYDIVIEILSQNEFGDWVTDDNSIYTSQTDIIKQIRGLDTVYYDYKFTVRDRWLNYTDTIDKKVKPLFEQLLDKSKYKGVVLSGDAPLNPRCKGYPGLWDDDIMYWPNVLQTQTDYTPTTPHVITFSIGQLSQVSRVKIWDYPEYDQTGRPYYVAGVLKEFEIWGCPTEENVELPPFGIEDESNPWILLGTYTSVKPSGLPYGIMNDEDQQAAQAGFDWECITTAPKVQYLRIRCLENYLGTTFMAIGELQVYGGIPE